MQIPALPIHMRLGPKLNINYLDSIHFATIFQRDFLRIVEKKKWIHVKVSSSQLQPII